MARLTEKAVAEQVRKLRGNLAAVARAFGVTRTAVWKYVAARPDLQAVLREAREEMVDNAESALYAAVIEREAWAVCFFLKTQAKDRGYVERQEVTGKDGGPVEHTEVVVRTRAEAAALLDRHGSNPPDPAPG